MLLGAMMVKLPIVYVMLGFRILGAPDPDPGWQPLGVYTTKAECMAAEEEARTDTPRLT
jgi:hypothetical protein